MKYLTIWLKNVDTNADDAITLKFNDETAFVDTYTQLIKSLKSADLNENPFLVVFNNKRTYIINANNILYIEIDE